MNLRRFYFTIASCNVFECIEAETMTEAIAIAAESWLPFWSELQWLNPDA